MPLGGLRADGRTPYPSTAAALADRRLVFRRPLRPGPVDDTGGMDVAPHPHTGLQTVSWLFEGEIEHRDSAGNHAMVRPGQVNLMTAGRGISHSEISTRGPARCTARSCGWRCPTLIGTPTRASRTTSRRDSPATAGRRGCSWVRCSGTGRRCRRTRRCWAPRSCSTPNPALPRRRPGVRARGARRLRVGQRRRHRGQPLRPRLRAARRRATRAQVVRRADAAAAARRAAVRRADRDVVELRRARGHEGWSGTGGSGRGRIFAAEGAVVGDSQGGDRRPLRRRRRATTCHRSRAPGLAERPTEEAPLMRRSRLLRPEGHLGELHAEEEP